MGEPSQTRPTRITREDSVLLQADTDRVFKVLLDFHSYKDWWPRYIRFQFDDPGPVKVGARLRISYQTSVRWVAEVTAIETNRRIAFRYGQGAWEGTAEWTLKPELDGIRVSYSIDIVPVPFWLRTLGRFLDLGAIHSKQMQGVLGNLGSILGSRRLASNVEKSNFPVSSNFD